MTQPQRIPSYHHQCLTRPCSTLPRYPPQTTPLLIPSHQPPLQPHLHPKTTTSTVGSSHTSPKQAAPKEERRRESRINLDREGIARKERGARESLMLHLRPRVSAVAPRHKYIHCRPQRRRRATHLNGQLTRKGSGRRICQTSSSRAGRSEHGFTYLRLCLWWPRCDWELGPTSRVDWSIDWGSGVNLRMLNGRIGILGGWTGWDYTML